MVVVLNHALKVWKGPHPAWWSWVLASPASLLFSGTDAVLVFFILSGFVLFLPYMSPGGALSYPRFVGKRVCRIYLPFLVALTLAILADWYCYRPVTEVGADLVLWRRPFPVHAILPNIFLVGPADTIFAFSGVFWTLVHEMRISLAFPIIAWLAMRLSLARGLIAGFVICALGLLPLLTGHYDLATIGYAGLFLVGAVMARHMERLRAFAAKIGPYGRGFAFVVVIVLFKSLRVLPESFRGVPGQGAVHGVAAALLIALTLTTIHLKRLLHTPVFRWLGRVSYSLYLVHLAIFYSMDCLLWSKTVHHVLLVLVAIGLSLLVTNVFHDWVERPAMLLGRRLGGSRQKIEVPGSPVVGAV
jgi:peptidoglycan/LPS O-acetylase OafA/YrhL